MVGYLFLDSGREIIKANNLYYNGGQMDFSALPSTMPESLLPLYQSVAVLDPISSAKTSMNKADSSLTYHPHITPRKRSRDTVAEFNTLPDPQKNKRSSADSSFLDQEILYQINNHESQIDGFIAQHVILYFSFILTIYLLILSVILNHNNDGSEKV